MACMKPVDDIVTQPSAPSARQAVSRATQEAAVHRQEAAQVAPSLHVQSDAATQSVASAHRAVRMATSVDAVTQAVTDAYNALYDARQKGAASGEVRTLTSSYRALQAEARAKARSLGHAGGSMFSDGNVFETRSPRSDGKTQHFFNESGSMRDPHGDVVESTDSTPERTVYDYVRDVDGNEYIDRP
jgi:hypothetical protein